MAIQFIIIGVIGLAIVWQISFYIIRRKEDFKRTLKLTFLKVTLPKKDSELDEKKETAKDFKESVAVMEQLFASLKSIYSGKILKKILGQDTLSFEYVAHEGEIYFFIVAPHNYKKLIEKQINGFYPDAIVEETTELNIFENRKFHESCYMHTKKAFFFPIKTYQKLESDPINNITNAFSKLEEDESAVVQILLKPIDDDWQGQCSKASSKIMKGKSALFTLNPFKLLYGLAEALLSSGDNSKDPMSKDDNTSALTQERAKTVDEKGDKSGFETMIRVIVTGNNKHLVETELTNISSSFSQFSYPDFNKFIRTLHHSNESLIKNYIYRYFRKPLYLKRMILNTEELSSLFHFPHYRYNKTPEIKWQNFKIVKAPSDIPKE